MEKTEFKSETFKYSLIVYIITLLCWNLYTLTIGFSNAIFPIIIQGILLFLILSKYKQAKIGIKIWSLILIFSYGISLLAKLVKIFLNDEIIISELINKIIFLTIGILIYSFNEKYVVITISG